MRKGSGLPERRGELDRLSERHGRPSSLGLLSGAEPECFAGWIEISALICGPESESRDIHTDLAHLGFRRPIEHEGPFEVAHPTCGHGHALHLDTCLGDVPVSQGGEQATGVAPLGGSRIANGECTIAQVVQGIVFPSEVSEALARSEQLLGHRDSLVDPSERHQHLTHADKPAVDQPVLPFFPEDGEGLLHEFQRALVVVTQAMAPAQRLHRERPLEAVADLLPDSDGLLGSLPRSFEVSQPAKHHRESGKRSSPNGFALRVGGERLLQSLGTLHKMLRVEMPEPRESADETKMLSGVPLPTPIHRGTKIVVVPLEASQPGKALADPGRVRAFGELQEIREVRGQSILFLRGLDQTLPAVLSKRLQKAVPD